MRKIESKSYKQQVKFAGVRDWEYKGHKCEMDEEDYGDVIKKEYYVTKPDGSTVHVPVSPYGYQDDVIELWIEAGYPKSPQNRNWDKKDLIMMLGEEKYNNYLKEKRSRFDKM